jgi:hypothetical protein
MSLYETLNELSRQFPPGSKLEGRPEPRREVSRKLMPDLSLVAVMDDLKRQLPRSGGITLEEAMELRQQYADHCRAEEIVKALLGDERGTNG